MRRNALWEYLDAEETRFVERGFGGDDEPITVRGVAIGDFAYSEDGLLRAMSDIRRGATSRTRGPVSLRYDPDKDTFFVIDGYHRLAEAMNKNKRRIDVKIVGSGYSDYWATP
jgi:hypothetical protein